MSAMPLKTLLTTLILLFALCNPVGASPFSPMTAPQAEKFIFPDVVYKQTVEYVYTLDSTGGESALPLISAIITSFDGQGNITAIELKDRDTLTVTEKVLEDLAQDIVLGNMEKEIVSIRYELNMVGDPVSADIVYFDLGELSK